MNRFAELLEKVTNIGDMLECMMALKYGLDEISTQIDADIKGAVNPVAAQAYQLDAEKAAILKNFVTAIMKNLPATYIPPHRQVILTPEGEIIRDVQPQ